MPPLAGGDMDYWFSAGVNHMYLSRGGTGSHGGAEFEATFRITLALIGLSINLTILLGICVSRTFTRSVMMLTFNLTIVNLTICVFYIPVYAFGTVMTLKDDTFCLAMVSVFRELTGVAMTSQMVFAFHMLCTVDGKSDLFTPWKTFGYIILTWGLNLLCYVSPVYIGIGVKHIDMYKSDKMCQNFTRQIRDVFGVDSSIHKLYASLELLIQLSQFFVTCFVFTAIHQIILKGKYQRIKSAVCRQNYSRASRTTGYFLICFVCVWTPRITINFLQLVDYIIPYAAAHVSLDIFFLGPILISSGLVFGVRALREAIGKCWAVACCFDWHAAPPRPPQQKHYSSYSSGLKSEAILSGESCTDDTGTWR